MTLTFLTHNFISGIQTHVICEAIFPDSRYSSLSLLKWIIQMYSYSVCLNGYYLRWPGPWCRYNHIRYFLWPRILDELMSFMYHHLLFAPSFRTNKKDAPFTLFSSEDPLFLSKIIELTYNQIIDLKSKFQVKYQPNY